MSPASLDALSYDFSGRPLRLLLPMTRGASVIDQSLSKIDWIMKPQTARMIEA
jgi:hypothetical protein